MTNPTNTSRDFAGTAATNVTRAGLSATPGPVVVGSVCHPSMADMTVDSGSPRCIAGTFSPDGSTATSQRWQWELTEPLSIDGPMTGTWISEDYRRFLVYDYNTSYSYPVGVNRGASNL